MSAVADQASSIHHNNSGDNIDDSDSEYITESTLLVVEVPAASTLEEAEQLVVVQLASQHPVVSFPAAAAAAVDDAAVDDATVTAAVTTPQLFTGQYMPVRSSLLVFAQEASASVPAPPVHPHPLVRRRQVQVQVQPTAEAAEAKANTTTGAEAKTPETEQKTQAVSFPCNHCAAVFPLSQQFQCNTQPACVEVFCTACATHPCPKQYTFVGHVSKKLKLMPVKTQ
jgi:hypothetical protein